MKWPWSKLRPREPQPDAETPATAEPEASPDEPSNTFRPEPGDIVLAPPRHDQFGPKHRAEVVELYMADAEPMAKVREPSTENEPWSVHEGSLEPLPSEPTPEPIEPSDPRPSDPSA